MFSLITPGFFEFSGFLIICMVLIQVAVVLFSLVQKSRHEQKEFQKSLVLLDNQIQAALDHRKLKEKENLSWNGYRKFVVDKKEFESLDKMICSFYLKSHDGRPLPPFDPGQYLTFKLKISGQTKSVIRCYSLSDSPHSDSYRVSIKKLPPPRDKPEAPPGLSSNFFHDQVRWGDILDVKAPSGSFRLDMTHSSPIVLIGGGVGMTPVLSMLNAIAGKEFNRREVWFFYGIRNSNEHCMKERLKEIGKKSDKFHIHICYSNPLDDDVKGDDYTHSERVSVDLFKRLLPSNNYEYYVCGPGPMMESITKGLKDWGVPSEKIHFEAFGPATVKKAGNKETKIRAAKSKFKVSFTKSGVSLDWDPKLDSILELGEANNIIMDSACRAGNCGTCLVAMKSGNIEYPHEPGFECEPGTCLACCAVPTGDVEIDA